MKYLKIKPQSLLIVVLIFLYSQTRETLGDVNNDGIIDILDVVRTVNIILEIDPSPTEYELWASDVNVDEITDILDIVILVNFIIGVTDCPENSSPCSYNLTECCVDTTSHEFTWEVETLGWFNGGIYDAAIITTDDVWIVGEIRQDWSEYNAAHWNGSEWELITISAPPYHLFSELTSIFAFGSDDIWVAATKPHHWDGEYWQQYFVADGYPSSLGWIRTIWGTSSSDLFFAGDSGNIVHYDGTEFMVMGSGSDYTILDMFGTASDHIWAVSDYGLCFFGATELLFFDGNSWSIFWEDNCLEPYPELYPGDLGSVWSDEHTLLVLGSLGGLWRYDLDTGEQTLDNGAFVSDDGNVGFPYQLSANNPNDIFVVGQNGLISHYNGIDWYHYDILYSSDGWNETRLFEVEIKDDFVIIGGVNQYNQPVVARGYRNSR